MRKLFLFFAMFTMFALNGMDDDGSKFSCGDTSSMSSASPSISPISTPAQHLHCPACVDRQIQAATAPLFERIVMISMQLAAQLTQSQILHGKLIKSETCVKSFHNEHFAQKRKIDQLQQENAKLKEDYVSLAADSLFSSTLSEMDSTAEEQVRNLRHKLSVSKNETEEARYYLKHSEAFVQSLHTSCINKEETIDTLTQTIGKLNREFTSTIAAYAINEKPWTESSIAPFNLGSSPHSSKNKK